MNNPPPGVEILTNGAVPLRTNPPLTVSPFLNQESPLSGAFFISRNMIRPTFTVDGVYVDEYGRPIPLIDQSNPQLRY